LNTKARNRVIFRGDDTVQRVPPGGFAQEKHYHRRGKSQSAARSCGLHLGSNQI